MARIKLAQGGGGRETSALINDLITARLGNPILNALEDGACITAGPDLVFSTDSFVVKPLQFPGGDIGKLAVCGTVNDIAVMGGIPRYLSLGLIIEEGLEIDLLESIISSLAATAEAANVQIVCGDTKVVEKGSGDGLFINTAGIGTRRPGVDLSIANARPGDIVMVNGPVGEHGAAIMGARKELRLTADLESDCACLHELVDVILGCGAEVRTLRDATRGGIAAVANEIAAGSQATVVVEEELIPVCEQVQGVCSLLGMQPWDLANEGKLIAITAEADSEIVLKAMRQHPLGKDAVIIGRIEEQGRFPAVLQTSLGVRTILEMPRGEMLPRIC